MIKNTPENSSLDQEFGIYKENSAALIIDWYQFLLKWKAKDKVEENFLSLNMEADHETLYNPKSKDFELYILPISKIPWLNHETSDKVWEILK
ncbi:MAG: hypothetical protein ACD_49C00009G0026 [uncultured bacterium (gcode 4)]|uniref:Uncharacterized protein n=1 Tax=uncultured bacterium (gcode 4) TaxID=1234023 RepID=K2AYG8_9BACT|nr:MAG: hypothetical protein ACD_49C00009G0026 [uncultured bacterium (gcode 4)]